MYRLKDLKFRKLNPNAPWLTPDSIKLIEALLNKNDVGLEWGGKSTFWLANQVSHLTSIESNPDWFDLTVDACKRLNANSIVEYQFFPEDKLIYGNPAYYKFVEEK